MSLKSFQVRQAANKKREEFLNCLLADLLIIDKNAGLILKKNNVSAALFNYQKFYFEKTLKQINNFLLLNKIDCRYNPLGLEIKLTHCTILIFKEETPVKK